MHRLFHELVSVLLLTSIVYGESPTIRQTNNGPVEGIEQTSFFDKKYYSFRGIPYAEVPITGTDPYTGEQVDRRFKPPEQLIRKWSEPLKAQNYGDGCIASTNLLPVVRNTSENCLFLNIFVPDGGVDKKTVLVWIHGGAFTEGEASDLFFGPDFLIDADNIVVTLAYRLGPFGFMNLGFGEYTGNMGLKDQQLALKWIYENIEQFSGNKNEILLFGESAGGASVNYHMLNEESRKYFNRAFPFSSSALNYYASYKPNHLERMQIFSQIQNKQKLIEYLKTADSADLAKIRPMYDSIPILLEAAWVPTIENPETMGAFITQSPEEIYKSDKAPVMDVIFSFNSQEYILFNPNLTKSTEPLLSGDWKNSKLPLPFRGFTKDAHPDNKDIKRSINIDTFQEYKKAVDLLRDAYFNDTTNVDAIKRGNIGLLSDMNFGYEILKAAQYQVKANNKKTHKNTFIQRFGVNTALNLVKSTYQLNFDGTAHGEDICFIFRCGALDNFKIYEQLLEVRDDSNVNYRTIKRMVNIITNFARTGDPSMEGDTPFKSSTSPDEIFSQDITNEPKSSLVTNIMEQTHFNTWKEIDDTYQKLQTNDGQHQDQDQVLHKKPYGHRNPDQKTHDQLQSIYLTLFQLLLQCSNLSA